MLRKTFILLLGSCATVWSSPDTAKAKEHYGRLPLVFEENRGQTDPSIRFLARGPKYGIFIGDHEVRLGLHAGNRTSAISLRLAGSQSSAIAAPEHLLYSRSNYFIGNNPEKWLYNVRHFERIRTDDIKKGISIVYRANEDQFEYDLRISPGADSSSLRSYLDGARSLRVDADGSLVIGTALGELRERPPVAWQEVDGQKHYVHVIQRVHGLHEIVFKVDTYDHSLPLVIDPVISYSTYLGGSLGDTISGIALDSSGRAFVTGTTMSPDLPVTGTSSYHGSADAFVAELSADGTSLIYATYVGGSNRDNAYSIALDASGNAYITGGTFSSDFPNLFGPGSTFSGLSNGFVTKLNSSGILSASRFLSAANTVGLGIALDASSNAYVTGTTGSATFPTTAGSLMPAKPSLAGTTAGFVAKLDTALNIVFGTYLGGSENEMPTAIAVDSNGRAYVTGTTNSANFPVTSGAYQIAVLGGADAFVAEFNPQGSALVYSTRLGGSGNDTASAIALDTSGNAYVTGATTSTDFPTTMGVYSVSKPASSFFSSVFVARINAGGGSLAFSTYLGGANDDSGAAIAVDLSGNVFVMGTAYSVNFPTTPGALKTQRSKNTTLSGQDLFLSKFDPTASTLQYSTYLGTADDENPGGMVLDKTGGVYIAGSTTSLSFPTTASALQPTSRELNHAASGFITKIDSSSAVLCNIVLSSNTVNVPGRGATGSFDFTAAAGCSWEITSDSFIEVSAPLSGFGNGTVNYKVDQNPSPDFPVTGTIRVNGGTLNAGSNILTVDQAAGSCSDPVFSPSNVNLGVSGGLAAISVSLPSTCPWNLVNPVPWIVPSNSVSSTGSGSLNLYAGPNSYSARQAAVVLAGKTILVTQSGGICVMTLQAQQRGAGAQPTSGSLGLTTGPGCQWYAYSSASWVKVSTNSGLGNGSASYSIAANPGTETRSTSLLIGDQTFSITQAGGPGFSATTYLNSLYTANGPATPLNNGPVGSAFVNDPSGMTRDGAGNLYIADSTNNVVRRVDVNGIISTFAGGGTTLADGGSPTSAKLSSPKAVAVDSAGNLYIAETYGYRIRKVSNNIITTIAGTGTSGFNATDQQAASAQISTPFGLAIDSSGNLYFTDSQNQRIRKVTPNGAISTVAGTGAAGFSGDGGQATAARLHFPTGLAIDTVGNLYFADAQNFRVRKITPAGMITTVAGNGLEGSTGDGGLATAAEIDFASGLGPVAADAGGSVYLAGQIIRKVTPDGIIHTISPRFNAYFIDGLFADPSGDVYAGAYIAIYRMTPAATFPAPPSPAPPTVTFDLDDDGLQDLTVYSPASGGFEYALFSQGTGSYVAVANSGVNIGNVTFDTVLQADFNGDLKSDVLFYSTATGVMQTGLGDGAGHFSYIPPLTISAGYTIIARGDFNRDGKTDLLVYRKSDGAAAIGFSNGDGTFTFIGQNFSPGFTTVAVADYNGDGISDVILYNNQTPPYNAYLLLGDGSGYFTASGLFFGPGYAVFPADLNADGKSDFILYRPSDGTVFVAISNGSGFTYHYLLYSAGFTSFKIGDVNGDGFPDLVLYNAVNANGYLLLGDGIGNFPTGYSLFFGPGMDFVDLRDFDGDGKQDVILYRTSDGTSFTGLSNGTGFNYTYNYFGPGRIVSQ